MNTFDENSFEFEANALNNNETKKENVLFGIVGALLGSLIGVALWIVISCSGYIAAISGFVMIVCAIKGYEFFAGRMSKTGVIVTIIITILMVYVSTHVSYGIDIYNAYKDYYDVTIFDGIGSVFDLLSEYEDIRSSFIKDLVVGYLFTILGGFSTVKNLLQK